MVPKPKRFWVPPSTRGYMSIFQGTILWTSVYTRITNYRIFLNLIKLLESKKSSRENNEKNSKIERD